MKKWFLFFSLLLLALHAPAQKINTEYHLKHNIKQDNQQFEFHVLDFGDKGVYQYDKSKFYFWLKAQQVHATQGYSSGLLLHGEFQGFYGNKQLAQRGYFYKGLKNGEWLYWNAGGTMTHLEYWRSGVKVGTEKSFSDEGKLLAQTKYKVFKTVRETPDSVIVTRQRKNTQEITLRDAYGHKTKVIRTKEGKLHGKQLEYKTDGTLVSENYKNGQKTEREASRKPFSQKVKGIFKKSGDQTDPKNKKGDKKPKKDSKKDPKKTTEKNKWNPFRKKDKTSA